MTPMINDWDKVFSDNTNVTISGILDANTLRLEDENSTNISVKKLQLKSVRNYINMDFELPITFNSNL